MKTSVGSFYFDVFDFCRKGKQCAHLMMLNHFEVYGEKKITNKM